MENIGQKLKDARKRKGLSVDQISEKTKIRPHVIQAFENDDFSILPSVYIKSFLKTLFKELNIKEEISDDIKSTYEEKKVDDEDFKVISKKSTENNDIKKEKPIEDKPLRKEFSKKSSTKTKKSITFDSENELNSNYTEIFKKKNRVNDYKPNLINYIVYSVIGLAIILIIYFSFFHTMFFDDTKNVKNLTKAAEDSAVVISSENKDLFSNFIPEKPDSIILKAKAIDTAWISIEIDGQTSEQMLMKPGMEKRWSAKEYFNITQGNTGAVEYTRNNELLQPFGEKGTVVRNIKITMDKVLNATKSAQDSLRNISNSSRKDSKKKREIKRIKPAKINN